ncbi:MAG: serine--tRNA ligase [Nitrospinota bacterium]
MLDVKLLKNETDAVKAALSRRGGEFDLDAVIALDERRVAKQAELEAKRREINEVSAMIGKLVKTKEDAAEQKKKMKEVSGKIKILEAEHREAESELKKAALELPNIPDASVPDGLSEEENVEVRKWGEPKKFGFKPKSHMELGERLGILDLKRAAKISGARFALYRGLGSRLERALINFMLNEHIQKGYEEVIPPFLVNAKSMTGTGQLPKFADDLFKVEGSDLWLIPTAEVPVTNIYADEIVDAEMLPKKFCAYTPCFRSEAGSYGKVTAGIIRLHQFNKVELVKLSKPEDSPAELEALTADAESILQKLELPYRVVELCAGDLGFGAAKTYDLEVWSPSLGIYVEISSCTNFTDFQARRMGTRFKREKKGKPELVHTLNGSALAVGRTWLAIVENYQLEDGSVEIPKALRRYMGDAEKITA